MRRAHLIMIAFAAAFISASCSGDSNGASTDPFDQALPFDAILEAAFDTNDTNRYRYDIEREAEVLIIECMRDAGFDFFVQQPQPPEPHPENFADRDFVESKGFGIIEPFRVWVQTIDVDALRNDPNRHYLTTLTGAEIQRYFVELDGEPPEPGQLPDPRSCRVQASEQAYGDWSHFVEVLSNSGGMAEERDTHPEWVAARVDWRACMVAQGFDYGEPDAIRSDVRRRMRTNLAEAFPNGGLPLTFDGQEWVLDAAADAMLRELLAFEIGAATANLECSEPLAERFNAVEEEVQQAWAERNRDSIEEFLSLVG